MDVARIDGLEAGLDALIERRVRGNKTDREREEYRRESVRGYHARNRDRLRWEWIRFHDRMSVIHADIAASHKAKAGVLLTEEFPEGG